MKLTASSVHEIADALRLAGFVVLAVVPNAGDKADVDIDLDARRSVRVSPHYGARLVVWEGLQRKTIHEECETLEELAQQIRREAPDLVVAPPAVN